MNTSKKKICCKCDISSEELIFRNTPNSRGHCTRTDEREGGLSISSVSSSAGLPTTTIFYGLEPEKEPVGKKIGSLLAEWVCSLFIIQARKDLIRGKKNSRERHVCAVIENQAHGSTSRRTVILKISMQCVIDYS
ncbi:uncharacterized protein [Venturia canescens]|uniref:uncharacterized protein n=1 Tax=Venturia canescens TaxID=32260 RepID=UPI001C9D2D85|nr:uncharacterized protein LOC122405734 [Venturia canescens]